MSMSSTVNFTLIRKSSNSRISWRTLHVKKSSAGNITSTVNCTGRRFIRRSIMERWWKSYMIRKAMSIVRSSTMKWRARSSSWFSYTATAECTKRSKKRRTYLSITSIDCLKTVMSCSSMRVYWTARFSTSKQMSNESWSSTTHTWMVRPSKDHIRRCSRNPIKWHVSSVWRITKKKTS